MWPTYQPHPPGRLLSDLLTSQSNMSAYIYMQLPGGWSDQTGPPSGWLVPPGTQNRLRHSLDQYFKSVRFIATSDGPMAFAHWKRWPQTILFEHEFKRCGWLQLSLKVITILTFLDLNSLGMQYHQKAPKSCRMTTWRLAELYTKLL